METYCTKTLIHAYKNIADNLLLLAEANPESRNVILAIAEPLIIVASDFERRA